MRILRLSLIALASSLTALAPAASAAPVNTFTTGSYYSGFDNNFSSGLISFTYNGIPQSGAAGNIAGSTGVVNGKSGSFSQVFCVDLNDSIYLNTTYNAGYSSTGLISGSAVNNAGGISWLLLNESPLDKTVDDNEALQAAIWQTEYGTSFALSGTNDAAMITQYNTDLAALSNISPAILSADIGRVTWITPTDGSGNSAQGQVGILATPAATPEPESIMLLGTGILGIAAFVRRRAASVTA